MGTLATLVGVALLMYAVMHSVLNRHSAQQSASFLIGSQFIKFQQLTTATRALMRASADATLPPNVVDSLVEDVGQKIADIRGISAQLNELRQQLGEDAEHNDLDIQLTNFLNRAEVLVKIDTASRRQRYSYWGPIDFAAASGSSVMRGFQEEIKQSLAKSEGSIVAAERISALLTGSLVLALVVVGIFVLNPLIDRLRATHEKKKVYEKKLSDLAHTDGLTKLPNRMSFLKALDALVLSDSHEHSDHSRASFGLLLIDLDNFKAVNDIFGHPAGNELLLETARRIQNVAQDVTMSARLSGDEFAVLTSKNTTPFELEAMAEAIRQEISKPYSIEGHAFYASASIGGSVYPDHASTSADMIRCADLALYASKRKRNSLTIFNELMMAARLEENRMRAALAKAAENNEYVVYYQPKLDVWNIRKPMFEALVRWRHPDLGILPPGRFLHLLDTAASITEMTEAVINQVAGDVSKWRNAGQSSVAVAINMPEAVLVSEVCYDMLERAVKRHGIDWTNFSIEITEDVFVNKYKEQILQNVIRLRELGVSIALDDFGTGFASLANIRFFQFDEIKIDRSFVADIGVDVKSEQIIRALIGLAESLGKHCVAEGVETQGQVQFLREAGCNVFQGYFFSRPQPFDEVKGFFRIFPAVEEGTLLETADVPPLAFGL
jgi:diguanylate cyclase (GGDEF)-like protein